MNDLWRWADPAGQQRQVRVEELRAALAGGVIAPNTPVWRPGWPAWQPAQSVPELSPNAAPANGGGLAIPPPPLAIVAAQQEFEAETTGPQAAIGEEPPPPPQYVPLPTATPASPPVAAQAVAAPIASPGPPRASAAPPVPPRASNAPPRPEVLPTAVGVPALSAAEMLGATPGPPRPTPSNAPPRPQSIKPPVPVSSAPAEMIEELSGSALLESVPGMPGAAPVASAPAAAPRAGNAPPKARTLLGIAPPTAASTPPPVPLMPPENVPAAPMAAPPLSAPPDPAAFADPFGSAPGSGPLAPPTNPVLMQEAPISNEAPPEPGGSARGLKAILHDLRAIQPRNKYLVPVVGALAGAALLLILALIVSAIRGKPSDLKTASTRTGTISSASAAPTTAAPAPTRSVAVPAPSAVTPVETPSDPAAAASKEPAFGDCAVAGPSHVVAPRAMVGGGLEASPSAEGLVLGFATGARDGIAVQLDPTTLAATATARARGASDARRVVGLVSGKKLTAIVDVNRRGDRLVGRRTITTTPPVDIGVAEGGIAWAPHGKDNYAKLFSIPGEGPVEALRAVPLGGDNEGIALTFRRGNAIWIGTAKGSGALTAEGGLHRVAGLGKVGSPTIAASGDRVLVAWADRAVGQEPWQVRTVVMDAGKAPSEAVPFALPDGGLGVQAMSPAAAGLTRGRFLLTWTEGPVSGHQVRAITLNPDGSTSGAALSASAQGINAGAPTAIVGPSGRGVVAFLAVKRKTFEVIATPIECARTP